MEKPRIADKAIEKFRNVKRRFGGLVLGILESGDNALYVEDEDDSYSERLATPEDYIIPNEK